MTYPVLSLVFLAAAVLAAALAARRRRLNDQPLRQLGVPAVLLGGAVLMLLTVVFDNIMIGVGLFHYAESQISGLRLGLAPVEDFSYPLAALILLPSLWILFGAERGRSETNSGGQNAQ